MSGSSWFFRDVSRATRGQNKMPPAYIDTHWVYEIGHDAKDVRFWRIEKERLKDEFDQEDIWIFQYEGRQI